MVMTEAWFFSALMMPTGHSLYHVLLSSPRCVTQSEPWNEKVGKKAEMELEIEAISEACQTTDSYSRVGPQKPGSRLQTAPKPQRRYRCVSLPAPICP